MPRQERTKSGTDIYHVMLRGINKQDIFEDDEDYLQMTSCLQGLTERYDENGVTVEPLCTIYSYCLMSNHLHLLIREQEEDISSVMKRLGVAYAYYFNKKYQRNGHLFQDRFRSEPVNTMEYFVTLLRYIHQNPVKAGIVEDAADYEWSSWKQDYLREPDELGWPISHVRAVLKRISLEDLRALVNEPCDANCVDVDNTRRLQDSEVRDFIIEQCGAKSVAEFQRLTMEEQTRIVLDTKAEGASIRQVMSHTGWSYRREVAKG